MYIKLVQDVGVESTVAQHLSETYGDRAFTVTRLASRTGVRWPVLGVRLHPVILYLKKKTLKIKATIKFKSFFLVNFAGISLH